MKIEEFKRLNNDLIDQVRKAQNTRYEIACIAFPHGAVIRSIHGTTIYVNRVYKDSVTTKIFVTGRDEEDKKYEFNINDIEMIKSK